MKVLILIILMYFIFKKSLKKMIKEGYMLWNSDYKKRYNRYNLKKQKGRDLKNKLNNDGKKIINYTVVYLPQNNQSIYNRVSGGYLI